ncbi:MAG: chemotaxis protein CheD, partial [Candidatus Sumerlaeota bacterium]|nr:chemotaxis protein CheD [Candidatus Sumerlaeota bacterium]
VDTGVPALLQALVNLGAERRRLIAVAAGAGKPLDPSGVFKIGERNYTVLRKVLWKNDILIAKEDMGGAAPRTMTLYLADGRTTIRSRGVEVTM